MARSAAVQFWAIGLGTAVAPLDTAVNIAFPAITRAFDLTIGDIQWVVISYVLTYAALMMALGRIGDLIGHGLVFRVGLAWSIGALLLCAFAQSFVMLLLARILQGVGAALVLSCGAALTTGLYGEERRSHVLGIYTMTFAIGAALGPLLGGILVELSGWPAAFWFRVPIAAAALLLWRDQPRAPADGSHVGASATARDVASHAAREPFDLVGTGWLMLSIIAMLLALNRLRDIVALPLGLVAIVASAAFIHREARHAAPIIDLNVFRLPGFALLNVANVLINLAAFTVWLLVPFYLARATDLPLAASGAVLATAWSGAVVAFPLAGRLAGTIPAGRVAFAGAAILAVGLILIGTWDPGTPAALLVGALMVQGFGLGLFQLAYTDIVIAAISRAHRGVAGSLTVVTRTIGTVAAAALVMLLFQSLEPGLGFFAAFRLTFLIMAAVAIAVVSLMATRSRA